MTQLWFKLSAPRKAGHLCTHHIIFGILESGEHHNICRRLVSQSVCLASVCSGQAEVKWALTKPSQPWEMRMNITYTGFIADVRRVIAVIKISQPIVTAQNFPTTWNPIPPTLHAEHIKKYLFFYCLLCFKSNWCPYNFLRAIHEAWPLRLCVWILSTRFNKSMVSSSQNE